MNKILAAILGVGFVGAVSTSALAQGSYPTKPITIILPVTPGGGTDTIVRIIADKLKDSVGQQIIVDNRPGAGGTIAGELVAKAAPDGYTLAAVTAAHATNPSLLDDIPYDSFKDLVPITQLTSQPYLLVVPNKSPAKTFEEFITYAKEQKNGINYASSGVGLLGHLGMELLKTSAGFKGTHIPYQGAGPALTDTIGGRVDAFFPTIVSGGPQAAQGNVRALAVTSLERSPLMPDVPTIAEKGFPGYEVSGWYGILAPAGTPDSVRDYLQQEIAKVLKMPDVIERIRSDGAEPVGSTPAEFEAYIGSEAEKWAKVVEDSGAKAQ
ncbi:MFS transporter [Agaricicola taiwanensis]|uniref:MFS transporter n=1 Tax=Agaricicola taiwanensis TaxID=591372 RepID=A0A8J2YEN3_9RHOB|nr:tripartite tricarboxylate transporter substrate binding protein [Agaricicola taiwanensis]GGE37950.1 MFS transporter [Agaricicola taiwanensis]